MVRKLLPMHLKVMKNEQKKNISREIFTLFWGFVIGDPGWAIDNLLFLFLLGLFFLFLAKKEVIESEKELTLDIIFALSILIAVFAGKGGILDKIGHSTGIFGRYINIIAVIVIFFVILYDSKNFLKRAIEKIKRIIRKQKQ